MVCVLSTPAWVLTANMAGRGKSASAIEYSGAMPMPDN